ncbi:MAG: type III secretion system export apparatus subunit SctV [Deltaproteobacteria bacterium]|nr:type III secretion system export apparatus subunit SctV [Deltaproteobacteria bacterium]
MSRTLSRFDAVPFGYLTKEPDVLLAIVVAGIVGMLILPMPPRVLDVMLALNLAASAVVLVSALVAERALSLATFPTLLLVTTLMRLGLNVSTTRMILASATAGDIVDAFGRLVVRGDVVVGIIVFLVVTLVQFMVIGKGAERVAEVGARFTLDAMPGKQMSIDASVRSGTITEQEGEARRAELQRESQFFGAMDGAMKFVRGDAVVGLIITALNLCAGLSIGVLRHGFTLAEAARIYSLLTVGDGLVSQIPALLITLSAGLLTTRVAAKSPKAGLAASLGVELFSSPKVLGLTSAAILVLGAIPGFPFLPFAIVAACLGAIAFRLHRHRVALERTSRTRSEATLEAQARRQATQARAQAAQVDRVPPIAVPIAIELDPRLSSSLALDDDAPDRQASADALGLVSSLLPMLRDALYLETGIRFPGVRVRSSVSGLPASSFVIKLKDVPVAQGALPEGRFMALETVSRMQALGLEALPGRHPLSGADVAWVALEHKEAVEGAGISAWTAESVLIFHLARALRVHARTFLGLQEVTELLDRVAEVYPALVRETVPKIVTVVQLADVLRRLVDEKVSIRDLKSILEALAEHGAYENDGVALTEVVRSALSLQIAHTYASPDRSISVLLLHGEIEEMVRSAIVRVASGSYLAMDPELRMTIMGAITEALGPVVRSGSRVVILTSADVRRYVRKLIDDEHPDVAVLSFQELPSDLVVHPLGRISIDEVLERAA